MPQGTPTTPVFTSQNPKIHNLAQSQFKRCKALQHQKEGCRMQSKSSMRHGTPLPWLLPCSAWSTLPNKLHRCWCLATSKPSHFHHFHQFSISSSFEIRLWYLMMLGIGRAPPTSTKPSRSSSCIVQEQWTTRNPRSSYHKSTRTGSLMFVALESSGALRVWRSNLPSKAWQVLFAISFSSCQQIHIPISLLSRRNTDPWKQDNFCDPAESPESLVLIRSTVRPSLKYVAL